MKDRLITHLRHVDLAVPDFARQREFYTGLWGLSPVADDDGIVFLAAEGSPEQYIVRLRRDREKRLDLISYGARDRAAVDQLAEQLGRDDVRLVHEPRELDTAGGGYGFRFFDVDGRTVEVSSDVAERTHRKVEKGESIPVRLSHVVVNSTNVEATRSFYEKHLSFDVSDSLTLPHMGTLMHFLRCNPQHHSLAIAQGPHTALHHVSFEMRGIDEYMRGTGRLLRAGVHKVWGPGRHAAGDNTFSYFLDPHGNTVEYTTELEVLDEDIWHPSTYDVSLPDNQDQWGTANPFGEELAKESFNDVDRGCFVAPPV
ncbi:VOC family protein [Streptomyces sp. NPDC048278]|uniref:VOC family protein n=1 Tax=Streptomyces sp. NPDC048278 TaxID=3155809 RepID=UPI00343CA836